MNNVLTLFMAKDTYIQFRIREEIKQDLQTVADLRGLSMSALLHSLAVRAIREEKDISPLSFERERNSVRKIKAPVVGEITSDAAERERIRRELEKPVGVPMLRQSAKLTPIPKKGELRSDEDKTAGSERPARGRRARK